MARLLVSLFLSLIAVSTATAEEIVNGRWVVNSERLSCISACGDLYALETGRSAGSQSYTVCAARIDGDKSGLRPGYNVRGIPSTCNVHDGDGSVSAEDFSCYCVFVQPNAPN